MGGVPRSTWAGLRKARSMRGQRAIRQRVSMDFETAVLCPGRIQAIPTPSLQP